MIDRRGVLTGGLAASIMLVRGVAPASAQQSPILLVDILQRARASEAHAHAQYVGFTKRAKVDGYRGIAYLFSALSTAELIHGQNFERLLASSGVELVDVPESAIAIRNTRENLIKAAADELESVYTFYPSLLEQLGPLNAPEAVAFTTYAWETEKQHLKMLKSIQRWTPDHFTAVAEKIENETGQYFVCMICGFTDAKRPEDKCPVCGNPAQHILKIEPPA